MGVAELIEIAAKLSVARMLERDDFEKRLAAASRCSCTSCSIR